MRVAFGSVEEQIADAGTGDMHMFRSDISEDDSGSHFGCRPFLSRLFEILFSQVWEAKEPKNSFRYGGEDAEPSAEGCWFDLITNVSISVLYSGETEAYLV